LVKLRDVSSLPVSDNEQKLVASAELDIFYRE